MIDTALAELAANHRWSWHLPTRQLLDTLPGAAPAKHPVAVLRAAAERGWLDYERCLAESLVAMRRAGAAMIFTYGALDFARALSKG